MLRSLIFISLIVIVMAQCPNPTQPGLQCSTDCRSIGYCSNNQWYRIEDCHDNVYCSGTPPICQSNSCDTVSKNYHVRCTESTEGQYIPNILDSSCSTYYYCRTISEDGDKYTCPPGTSFDYCTRLCQPNAVCGIKTCSTGVTALSSNRRLAYVCTTDDLGEITIIWWACNTGAYDSKGACVSFADYNCQATGICTGAGNIPIPDTNCEYRKCYVDGTHDDNPCPSGYHYDDTVKKCTVGACTQL